MQQLAYTMEVTGLLTKVTGGPAPVAMCNSRYSAAQYTDGFT